MVGLMPGIWTPDDLSFALIRTVHLERPRQVADDLLSAADQPASRLREVSALQARLCAAEVLIQADERDEAVAMLRHAVQADFADAEPQALLAAASILFAQPSDPTEAEALVTRAVRARPRFSYTVFGAFLRLAAKLATDGHFEQALRVSDQAVAIARTVRGTRAARRRRRPPARRCYDGIHRRRRSRQPAAGPMASSIPSSLLVRLGPEVPALLRSRSISRTR
jgi:hypothetical protein